MPKLAPLPLKSSEWTELRQAGAVLVDKTAGIYKLVSDYTPDFPRYIARTHGMGKTMLCSQLEELFAHGTGAFAGTAIHDLWTESTSPVVRLELGSPKRLPKAQYQSWFKERLTEAFVRASLIDCNFVIPEDLDELYDALAEAADQREIVVIIDDWDAQILHHLNDGKASSFLEHFWTIFWDWLQCELNSKYIFVTGTMSGASAKELLYDLNLTSYDSDLADLLGITPLELETCYAPYLSEAATRLGVSERSVIDQIESYYLGYNFDTDEQSKLYTPLDLNHFFAPLTKRGKTAPVLSPYCFDTRNHYGLKRMLKGCTKEYHQVLRHIGKDFPDQEYAIHTLASFTQLELPAYLYETGYFTLKSTDEGEMPYCVRCPNSAVREGLTNLLRHLDD